MPLSRALRQRPPAFAPVLASVLLIVGCADRSEVLKPPARDSGPGPTIDSGASDEPARPEGCTAEGAFAARTLNVDLPTSWPAELSAETLNGLIQPYTQVSVGDLDGDGLPDLLLAQFLGHAVLMHNDGGCEFSLWHDLGPVATARAVDIDGDGDVDVLVAKPEDPDAYALGILDLFRESGSDAGGPPPQNIVLEALLNDGDGASFTTSDLGHTDAVNGCSITEPEPMDVLDMVWGIEAHDLDHDGDLDISVRNYFACPATNLAMQDGRVVGPMPSVPACRADSGLALGDVNADGMADLVCTSFAGFGTGVGVQVFLGDGETYTPLAQGPLHVGDSAMGTALLDIDGDGQLDLFTSDNGWPWVSLHRDGIFVEFGRALGVDPTRTFDLIDEDDHTTTWTPVPLDYDGDGDLDIVVSACLEEPSHPYPQHLFVYRNEAGETMGPVQGELGLDTPADEMTAVRVDIDGDGDEDVLLGSALLGGYAVRMLINGSDADFVAVEAQLASGQPAFGTRLIARYGPDHVVAHNLEGNTGLGNRATAQAHVARLWTASAPEAPLSALTLVWPDGGTQELDLSGRSVLAVHPDE